MVHSRGPSERRNLSSTFSSFALPRADRRRPTSTGSTGSSPEARLSPATPAVRSTACWFRVVGLSLVSSVVIFSLSCTGKASTTSSCDDSLSEAPRSALTPRQPLPLRDATMCTRASRVTCVLSGLIGECAFRARSAPTSISVRRVRPVVIIHFSIH